MEQRVISPVEARAEQLGESTAVPACERTRVRVSAEVCNQTHNSVQVVLQVSGTAILAGAPRLGGPRWTYE